MTLSELQLAELGKRVVDTFSLKLDPNHTDRYVTMFGSKTVTGLGRVVLRLVDSVEFGIVDETKT